MTLSEACGGITNSFAVHTADFNYRRFLIGRLLGYCAIVPHEEYLSLCKLFVHSDFRNKGISRSFLDEAIALCQFECGFEKICLTVNKRN
ncbi:MAG: GNAT family N-acetyltransferase, partial [Oscillospiraceae bacterium]|nr:GNAT family N-acetyltransferase [Oscillospiraceae bacterium]